MRAKTSVYLQATAQTAPLDPNLLNKHYKREVVAKFNEARHANPRLNAQELARMIGSSSLTLK